MSAQAYRTPILMLFNLIQITVQWLTRTDRVKKLSMNTVCWDAYNILTCQFYKTELQTPVQSPSRSKSYESATILKPVGTYLGSNCLMAKECRQCTEEDLKKA